MKLTVGMATYDDYDGVVFSIQALRLYHHVDELLVVDNNPGSLAARHLADFCQKTGARYIPMPEPVGTSAPRNRVFTEATGDVVLCMDSHVLIQPGALQLLREWFIDVSSHNDLDMALLHGPMMLDSFNGIQTHFDSVWRAEMWGIWGHAWRCRCSDHARFIFSMQPSEYQQTYYLPISPKENLAACPYCGNKLPDLSWSQHESQMLALGFEPCALKDDEPAFDIPGQGLGLFACRKDAWLGFNPHFRGFGGEEMYIHEKFRKANRRVFCLPFLKWWHRFGRPSGVKYPLTRWNKVRNYVLGHNELGLPLDPVHAHFVTTNLMTQSQWDYLVADPIHRPSNPNVLSVPSPKEIPAPSITQLYQAARGTSRDLDQHMDQLRLLAGLCDNITEISKRKESTIAFVASGRPVISYNTESGDQTYQTLIRIAPNFQWHDQNSTQVESIAATDLLFIDSEHTYARLKEELNKYATAVRRFIILHDTQLHGERGADNGPGLNQALREFTADNPAWFVYYYTPNQFGLTVLGIRPSDRPANKIHAWAPMYGPGTELTNLLSSLGVVSKPNCTCRAMANQMDIWGVQGCREPAHHQQILTTIHSNKDKWGWKDRVLAITKAVTSGLAFKLNPLDPFPSLIDEAIRRAELAEQSRLTSIEIEGH